MTKEITNVSVRKVLDAIDELVNADGSFTRKLELIMEYADERDKTSLEEFISWFDGVDFN